MNHIIESQDFPPNYDDIKRSLELTGEEVFCYGNVIYNPSKKTLTEDLINHEAHHIKQQLKNPSAWWSLYLEDPIFRASQEIPAYQIQYQTAKRIIKDRERLHQYLVQIAKNLSSERYGKVMTFSEAIDATKSEKLFNVARL